MPYIKDYTRSALKPQSVIPALTAGELNYQLTCIVREYCTAKGVSYTTINDVVGAFEGAKLEFYRRIAAPYEDKKIEENGDVYFV